MSEDSKAVLRFTSEILKLLELQMTYEALPEAGYYSRVHHIVERIIAYGRVTAPARGADMPEDYCLAGSARCIVCGWQGEHPVSGCPECHNSFV